MKIKLINALKISQEEIRNIIGQWLIQRYIRGLSIESFDDHYIYSKCPVKRFTQIIAFSYHGSYGLIRIRSRDCLTFSDEISLICTVPYTKML